MLTLWDMWWHHCKFPS